MAKYSVWKANLSDMNSGKVAGVNVPAWVPIRDGVDGYAFTAALLKEVWLSFHINHDWDVGTDMYPHVHYVPLTNEAEGVIRWGFEYTCAKGHDQENFPATTTVYVEQYVPANSQYRHMIAEVSDDNTLPGADLETAGIILMRVFRDGGHPNDTYAGDVAGVFVDLNYQADRSGTLRKVPAFNDQFSP